MQLIVNGKTHQVDVEDEMPLLWVLRDVARNHRPQIWLRCRDVRRLHSACRRRGDAILLAAGGDVKGDITTIEGLGTPEAMHAVQKAWVKHQVAQCGYCQSGQIMSAAALLRVNPNPSDEDIDQAMSGNLCRCGTYPRIRAAIKTAARELKGRAT